VSAVIVVAAGLSVVRAILTTVAMSHFVACSWCGHSPHTLFDCQTK
jgi:hypothetical protein